MSKQEETTEITKSHYSLLFALFQAQSLIETLDDMESESLFVKHFKNKTKNYKNFLELKVMRVLDEQYGIDEKQFEIIDKCISENAKEFGLKGFESFFKIVD